MSSDTALDSPASFFTLKYTVLVPSPDERVKLGVVEYGSHEAPAKLDDSLAM